MAVLPKKYDYLLNQNNPKVIKEALKLFGTLEASGENFNNATILSWAKEVGLKNVYTKDSIPWCGLFTSIVVQRAGFDVVKNPLRALSWATFGNDVPDNKAMLGDILVFVRKGGGHVGFYVGEDKDAYHVLGGNQSDSVNITRILKTRLYDIRRCDWRISQPNTVKSILLSSNGIISTNEA